jgi:hypothetical protein
MRKITTTIVLLVALLLSLMVPSAAAQSSSGPTGLPNLAGCFGHEGIQITGFIAYECVFQPPGLGGALYWSANESNFNWNKHPGSGLLWVEASTVHVATDTNPPNTIHSFWVGIANHGTFCTVIGPGYDQHPTKCEINGAIQTMTSQQQASYNQFAAAMAAAHLPDCAWSMTAESSQCDIDS